MPPTLLSRRVLSSISNPTPLSVPTFLLPFLHRQRRTASILGSLSDTPGSYNKRIRRGRGPSSGKGKTSGRGHKGQKQHGKVPANFNGGQTPDFVVHGKYGFVNPHSREVTPINLDTLQLWINASRLDPTSPITPQHLMRTRVVHGTPKDGLIKLLARERSCKLTSPIHIVVSQASEAAIKAVEAAGGSVTTRYYTADSLRRIKAGDMHSFVSMRWDPAGIKNAALDASLALSGGEKENRFAFDAQDPVSRAKKMGFPYRLPDPTSRKDIEYYRDPKNRGYLAHTVDVEAGEVPDLYFSRKARYLKTVEVEKALGRRIDGGVKGGRAKGGSVEDERIF